MSAKARVLSLLGAILVVTTVACADATTTPQPHGARAARDTTVIQGDTTLCRTGWVVVSGRYVCNETS
jgi:phenylalanyl-tRNA synthetase alpha subunit